MTRRLIVEADGGSRGNPGPAGYGALVRDGETGSILARRNGFLGIVTNNVAEYTGLIEGLTAAQGIDPTAAIEVRMDSKLVVEQVSGRWQVKHPSMKPLARQAVSLTSGFSSVRLTWIPRAQNSAADALANEAMDARASTHDALDDDLDPLPAAAPVATYGPAHGAGTTLLLLRHGQTRLSIDRRFSGRGDPPLTELGHRQAAQAAERLAGVDVAAIVSSPLGRARQTADAVSSRLGLPVVVDDGWIELDFGSWEGLTFAEVRESDPDGLAGWFDLVGAPAAGTAPHGGETFAVVGERVAAARDALVAAYPEKTVVVVSHVTPIKMIGRDVVGAGPDALARMWLDLASLSGVRVFADGTGSLRSWNETSYLTG